MDLDNRHALVCGASKGIGRAAAIALAERGATITALARSEDKLESLVAAIEASGGHASALVADLEDRDDLAARLDGLLERGPVHIVINNTGGPPSGALLEATEDEIVTALSRHLFAAHLIMKKTLPGMRATGYGRFIQVLSTSVREPIPNLGVSNLTRAAMASWAKTLSRELPPGVTINNVLPGFTDTTRLSELAESIHQRTGRSVEDVYEGWRGMAPEARLARPDELGVVIAFLASPEASFVRGVSLPVDGGRLRSI